MYQLISNERLKQKAKPIAQSTLQLWIDYMGIKIKKMGR